MADFLAMSDADFLASGPSKLQEVQANAETVEHTVADAPTPEPVVEPLPGAAEAEEVDEEGQAAEEGEAGADVQAPEHDAGENEEDGSVDDAGVPAKTDDSVKADAAPTSTSGLPEGAERVFATFRANGRDMQVKSVDEAIRLMQMGANYSQKRAADKKNLGFVRVLEQNGMLDHEKLSYAVDLLAGKPEAIGKLLKDSKIDVHDLDEDKVAAYRAESRAPSAAVMAIEEVVDGLSGNTHFDRLVGDMSKWDEQSQALLGQHPQALTQLTEQVENGIYDKVMDEVNRQQVLGNFAGVPLMQAYNQIGQEMAAAGAFNAPAPKGPVTKLVTPGKKASAPSQVAEERRRAAAPSKGVTTATEDVKDPKFLAMSDEDFLKTIKR